MALGGAATFSRARSLVAVPTVLLLGLLVISLVSAPFAFYLEGQAVYQWPDSRITVLEVLSIFAVLVFVGVARRSVLRPLAAACLAFAAWNLLLFIVFNYGTNAPDGLLPQLFSANAAMTAMGIMDSMRLSPVYGLAAQTIAWYVAVTVSFLAFRWPKGPSRASLDAVLLGSSVLAVYALGVYLVIPQWSMRAVTGLQDGTLLAWFTNDDLFFVGVGAFAGCLFLRYRGSRDDRRARNRMTGAPPASVEEPVANP
jgi:hypothetical protein